jgi:hypothetical protein
MAYSDSSEYPTGLWSDDLGSDRDVATIETGAAGTVMKVARGMIFSNADGAAQTVLVADSGGTTFMTVLVPAEDSIILPLGFTSTGLQFNMAVNTADVVVTVFYFKD